MACTNLDKNESQAGAFKSDIAPEMYIELNDNGSYYSRSILQVFKMAFSTPSDESQQFLDIGCGTGDFTREHILPTCEPCRRIVAIDCSESMLKYAREKYAHEKIVYDHLDIDKDVSAFSKKHGGFQRVYSFKTLQWSQDLSCTLKNIAELLVPGGECLLFFFARTFLMESFKQMSRLEPWSKYADVLLRGVPKSHDIIDQKGQHAYLSAALSSAGLIPYTAEVLVKPHLTWRPGDSCESTSIPWHVKS
ncbi:juvenile hormone acid O-methyltransferase [Rhipicephalus sanguineus]|uniref:juvenile hormone acid O-methyltransferase n=1 Tax=Rhipicephalus sanguineus TaxID=34632 RepID=UPI0020C2B60E|nr:juvenile hormone acid O-methyltransferase [Rhipicephalus sanguineus]